MCGALEELVNEGVERGKQEGILANIRICEKFKCQQS